MSHYSDLNNIFVLQNFDCDLIGQYGVGIKTLDELIPIKIFPNPVTDYIVVERSEDLTSKFSVRLTNALGHKISDDIMNIGQQKLIIHLSALKPGIYFVHLSGRHVNYKEKILVIK